MSGNKCVLPSFQIGSHVAQAVFDDSELLVFLSLPPYAEVTGMYHYGSEHQSRGFVCVRKVFTRYQLHS